MIIASSFQGGVVVAELRNLLRMRVKSKPGNVAVMSRAERNLRRSVKVAEPLCWVRAK